MILKRPDGELQNYRITEFITELLLIDFNLPKNGIVEANKVIIK